MNIEKEILKNLFVYEAKVKYKEDYFNNPNHPLNHTHKVNSVGKRTKADIQKLYKHAEVLSIELINTPQK